MREIAASDITDVVRELCISANCTLTEDVKSCIASCANAEPWPVAKGVLENIIENYQVSEREQMPICQDTGVACVFVEMGQDVHVVGSLQGAINEGVRRGYKDGFLRCSVVADPLRRVNTNDNTPAMIYFNVVEGDGFNITVAPKGFGSENMSKTKMLRPSDGVEGVKAFVLECVEVAGPNPCPPIVVGVGIGGTFDKAANIAKEALLVPLDEVNPDSFYAELEAELLQKINALGIGPQGFGGQTTALAVRIKALPTHIAGLPVAVNINCHVARHRSADL